MNDATIEPPETIHVDSLDVACDGGGALGHPKVFLSLENRGRVECPYCDRLFILDGPPPRTGH